MTLSSKCALSSLFVTLLTMTLVACGGGGGNDPPPPPPPPPAPSALSYPAPPAFRVGTAITALAPTVTGNVSTYSVSPTLPAGLALNTTSGVISGTPTSISATANYVITASNTSGSTTHSLAITVNDTAPTLQYPSATYSFATGAAITAIVPAVGGGAATGWSIDRSLPAGLVFHADNGRIDGTPTATSAQSVYRVTAHNSGGDASFDLAISVSSAVLLELGHASELTSIEFEGQRILSLDASGHVVLWNAQNGSDLYSRTVACDDTCGARMALAGSTAVLRTLAGLEVREAADGANVAQIVFPASAGSWWRLSADGNYLAAGDATTLRAWSRDGSLLFSRPGNYADAKAFAAIGEIRVGAGAAGSSVIETIAVPAGTSTLSPPFQGALHSWFDDGERFLTNLGNTVWVYSKSALQQDIAALPTIANLQGHGNWLWTSTNSLTIYVVGSASTPAASFSIGVGGKVVQSGDSIAILPYGSKQLSIVDLAGATPTSASYQSPLPYLSAFAAASTADWVFGNARGVMLGEVPNTGSAQVYSLGRAMSIAANSQRIAVAVASGRIYHFDTATQTQEGFIDFPASQLALSSAGSLLEGFANGEDAQYSTDRTLRVYSLPSQTVVEDRAHVAAPNVLSLLNAAFSASGTVISEVFSLANGTTSRERRVTALDGTPIFSETFLAPSPGDTINAAVAYPPLLAPNGNAFATSSMQFSQDTTSNIYVGGTLATAVSGVAIGWIDDDRLLVNRYQGGQAALAYVGADIVAPSGQVLAPLVPLPHLFGIQSLPGNLIYSPQRNVIYNVQTGSVNWSSNAPTHGTGAVAGSNVVFASDAYIRIEPR
jgi:hypothetical protein